MWVLVMSGAHAGEEGRCVCEGGEACRPAGLVRVGVSGPAGLGPGTVNTCCWQGCSIVWLLGCSLRLQPEAREASREPTGRL